jgi:hypothetical protein
MINDSGMSSDMKVLISCESAIIKSAFKAIKSRVYLLEDKTNKINRITQDMIEAFGKDKEVGETQIADEAATEDRPVSQTVNKINDTVQALPDFPGMSEIKSVSNSVNNTIQNIGKIWGFAKPEVSNAPHTMDFLINQHQQNVDGARPSYSMADSHEQAIEVGNIIPNPSSMNLSYFTDRYASYTTFALDTTMVPGKILRIISLDPSWYYETQTSPPLTLMSPLCFASQFFRKWRGGFEFQINAFTNAFQNFRIGIALAYGVLPASISDSTNFQHSDKWIVDFKSGHSFNFDAAYESTDPWKRVHKITTDPYVPTKETSIGVAVIYVDTALQVSDSAPATVNFDIWVRGKGIQFNEVDRNTFFVNNLYTEPSVDNMTGQTQMSDLEATVVTTESTNRNLDMQPKILSNSVCHGQVLTSFKQLLNIHELVAIWQIPFNPGNDGKPSPGPYNNLGYTYITYPFNFGMSAGWILNNIAMCYAFFTGDMELSWHMTSPNWTVLCTRYNFSDAPDNIGPLGQWSKFNLASGVIQNAMCYSMSTFNRNQFCISTRTYNDSRLPLLPVTTDSGSALKAASQNGTAPECGYVFWFMPDPTLITSEETDIFFLRRKPADNFRLHVFNGIPPIRIVNPNGLTKDYDSTQNFQPVFMSTYPIA